MVEKRRNNSGGYDYLLNTSRFTDGYLIRAFALKSLATVEGMPDVDELQRFNQVCSRSQQPCHHSMLCKVQVRAV